MLWVRRGKGRSDELKGRFGVVEGSDKERSDVMIAQFLTSKSQPPMHQTSLVAAFIFITCQVFMLIAQTTSYWSVLRAKEKARGKRGRMVNLRGSGNGGAGGGGYYRPGGREITKPLLEGDEEGADEEEGGGSGPKS